VESEDPQAPKLCSDEAVTQRQGGLKRKGILNNEQRIKKLRLLNYYADKLPEICSEEHA